MRADLSIAQQAVQSCHGAIEASKAFNFETLPEHPSVIILTIKNEQKLHQIRKYLIDNDVQHVHFYEPDLDGELTSLATQPIYGERRRLFRKFQLYRPKNSQPDHEQIQYVVKFDDGYYRYAGDCSRQPDRTNYVGYANLFDSSESAAYHAEYGKNGTIVPVRVCYFENSKSFTKPEPIKSN